HVRTPLAARPPIASPFARVEHSGAHPPAADLVRREGVKHALRGGGNLDRGDAQPGREIRDGACSLDGDHPPLFTRVAYARATSAATRALFTTSLTLTSTERPPDSAARRARRRGVTSAPLMASAPATA